MDFAGDKQPKLAGLYAEGRVETETTHEPHACPAIALVRDGDKASAWRVKGSQAAEGRSCGIGERDPRTGDYVVSSGLAEGDQVLRHPSVALKDGQPVQTAADAEAAVDGRLSTAAAR